jgi:hypothetical protein
MYRLLIALMLFATVSHGLPTNATTRMATEGFVSNRVAQAINAHATNDTAHAALLAGKLDVAATNEWTVTPHDDWIKNAQSGVTLTNLTSAGEWLKVPSGRIYTAPFNSSPGDLGRINFIEHTADARFRFNDINGLSGFTQAEFYIEPIYESIFWSTYDRRWYFPGESASNIVASRAYVDSSTTGLVRASITNGLASTSWVAGYVASNAPSGPGLPAVWTNMTWGAAGTNATYRMSWDGTNGTFKIEEILP